MVTALLTGRAVLPLRNSEGECLPEPSLYTQREMLTQVYAKAGVYCETERELLMRVRLAVQLVAIVKAHHTHHITIKDIHMIMAWLVVGVIWPW